jgi:TPR repeat protein
MSASDAPVLLNKLGMCYSNGIGVEKNLEFAFSLFKKASKLGYKPSKCNLSIFYLHGIGIEKNDAKTTKAIKYLEKLSYEGSLSEQIALGDYYHKIKDIENGIKFMKLAADQGDAISQYNLSILYLGGIGNTKDIEKAIHYLTLSANAGYPVANDRLGGLYLGNDGVDRNIEKAIHYLKHAANANNRNSQHKLGHLYKSDGLWKNIGEAIKYLTLAANKGSSCCMYDLANIYHDNTSLYYNLVEAARWFKAYADQNQVICLKRKSPDKTEQKI